ncbi:MAG: hypothetical protein ACQETI_03650 [Halobacteriota archaeon]
MTGTNRTVRRVAVVALVLCVFLSAVGGGYTLSRFVDHEQVDVVASISGGPNQTDPDAGPNRPNGSGVSSFGTTEAGGNETNTTSTDDSSDSNATGTTNESVVGGGNSTNETNEEVVPTPEGNESTTGEGNESTSGEDSESTPSGGNESTTGGGNESTTGDNNESVESGSPDLVTQDVEPSDGEATPTSSANETASPTQDQTGESTSEDGTTTPDGSTTSLTPPPQTTELQVAEPTSLSPLRRPG